MSKNFKELIEIKNEKELAEIIVNHLPISLEDAEHFIDSIQKGYTWGNINYAMALSMRDKTIEQLLKNQPSEEIYNRAKLDPFVNRGLMLYKQGTMTYLQALENMVLHLSKEKERITNELIVEIQSSTRPNWLP